MLDAMETYLALRRAAGFAMSNAAYLLRSFAAFAAERAQTHVETQTAIDWAALGPSVAQRDARLKAVCRFVRHIQIEDARHELPPANHFGARKKRRTPHIYSTDEIDCLVEAALRLRPKGGLRPLTFATLIALLSVTGLRISEALKLTVADVTGDGLLIRETKFRKTRLVPLHDCGLMVNALAHRFNAGDEIAAPELAGLMTALRRLIKASIPSSTALATSAAYTLAPALRYHLRRTCTNLVQIADRCRALGLVPPPALLNLICRFRVLLNGDRSPHGA